MYINRSSGDLNTLVWIVTKLGTVRKFLHLPKYGQVGAAVWMSVITDTWFYYKKVRSFKILFLILFLGKSGRAGLHITSIVTYWKQMQLVRLDILKHSADVRCCRLYDNLLQRQSTWSRKFPAAVEHACATTVVEANPTPTSPQNLLTSESESRSLQTHPSDRKRLLTWVSDIDTEQQLAKLRTLEIQGRWLEWTDVMHSDLSWRRLLHGLDDANLRFSLQVITNTAPTPDNLRRWGVTEIDTSCSLCGKPCTLRHVLNACSVALFQGRYTWRHNSVLSVLQRHLLKFWDYARQQPEHQQAPFIRFVPERARAPRLPVIRRSRRPLPYQNALRCAQDWEFLFDLGEGLVFPPEIAATSGRLTSGAGYPWWSQSLSLDFPWSCLILFDRVQLPSFARLAESRSNGACVHSQLHVWCCTCACHFVAPIPADAATFDGDRCSSNLPLAFWLCPFLPSLMFKHSLQLWCLFFFVTLSSVARNASLCAASRERRDALRTE